ncbi:MAG: hypothetical protein ABEH35_08260 [Haloarculaceae archaeon]
MRPQVLLVVLAVLTAGCSGLGVFAGEERSTITPAPVPATETTATPEPPEAIQRAQRALDAIPERHRAILTNRSYTSYRSYVSETSEGANVTITARNVTTWVESDATFRRDAWTRRVTTPSRNVWLYHNEPRFIGIRSARSVYVVDGQPRVRVWENGSDDPETVPESAGAFATGDERTLARYLDIDVTSTEVVVREGTRLQYVAGEGTAAESARWQWFRTRAYVTEEGLVRRLVVKLGPSPGDIAATLRLRYESVGTTTVPEPEWLDAENESARTGTGASGRNVSRVGPATRGSGPR